MEKIAIHKKAEELKEIIDRLELKIKSEKVSAEIESVDKKERMEYLNRKLNIFNQLLQKYILLSQS